MSLLSNKSHSDRLGNSLEKFFLACLTRAFLSAKNKTFFTQLCLDKTSTIEMAVLVLPVPVAQTNRAVLWFLSKASATEVIASFW